jgi:hypothetical protein
MEETPISPEPVAAPAPAAPVRVCDNCGSQLLGEHCYACGQPTKGLVRHFGSILGDFFDSVLNLDTRTFRTLVPLLFKPGYLTLEYFRGHRVRYVSPVRLFFFLCIAAIFIAKIAIDFTPSTLDARDDAIESAQTVADVEHVRDEALEDMQEALAEIPDVPGARVGLEIGIQRVKEDADARIAWIRARDQAIREDKPVPPWEGDAADDDDGVDVNVARESNGTQPPSPRVRVNSGVGRMQFNDKPWHEKTNPVTVDWLPTQGNLWLNALIGRAQENAKAIEKKPRLLFDAFFGGLPQTLLVLLPVFALLLKIMYLFKRRLYMEHLIVALHSHAFLCAAILVMIGVYKLREMLGAGFIHGVLFWVEVAIWVWMPLYLLIMQLRVYRQGWIMTALKYVILGFCYVVLLSIGIAINFAVSLVAM